KPALLEAAAALREVHRTLVQAVRAAYEKEIGPAGGPGQMLRLLTEHPYFAWLHPMSELIVDLDSLLAQEILPAGTVAGVRQEIDRRRRADGLGIEALVTGTAFTSKPADRPSISYADQPGSGIGGLLRLRGGIARDFRWIVGGVAEQVQRGAFLGPAPESGNRFGGQLGV